MKDISDLYYCDLTDYKQINNLIEKLNIKYIFMLAAKSYGIGTLKDSPTAMARDTITMDSNILEAAFHNKVKKIMYVSSSTVYQESFKPLSEEDLDLNQDPYRIYMGVGWVKRYVEKLCEFYSQLGLNINIVRPTNVYGPHDKYQEGKAHVIPAIIKRALEGQNPLVIWGQGYCIKDLIYIDDFIRDMLKVTMYHNEVDAFNLCSCISLTINEIVDVILKNFEGLTKVYDITKPESIPYKSVLRNKLDSLYGKESYMSIDEGIKKTILWLKKELNHE